MNDIFGFATATGMFVIAIPAAIIVLIGREWFLLELMSRLGIFVETHYSARQTKNPLLTFDVWAFIVLCFSGYSWGGFIVKNKKDTISSYIFGQLWFIMVMLIAFIFLHAKDISKTSYMYLILIDILKKSWSLHLLNYLPLPPFDASFFYMQKPALKKFGAIFKIIATIVIIFFPATNDFITGESFLLWAGLR
ncbi:MAG: hypothetical protein OEV66_08280 [Spirochaetia bacterium]|nr:hypothetical protein [Spirochaetia bacterium]